MNVIILYMAALNAHQSKHGNFYPHNGLTRLVTYWPANAYLSNVLSNQDILIFDQLKSFLFFGICF